MRARTPLSSTTDPAPGTVGRRPVILGGLAVAATTTLVACGSGSTSGSGSTAKPSAKGGGLVAVSDVPVGGAVGAKDSHGKPIIVAQPAQGEIVAFTAICTHMGCTVAPAGKELKCPCHGSVYDAFTGKNISGPAPKPLAPVSVTVSGGEVVEG